MKPIHEALKLTTVNEVEIEITARRELKFQMVGCLYPAILQGEIDRLLDLKEGLLMLKGRREIERLPANSSRPIQLHVGKDARGGARGKIWHTDSNGLYWMGDVYHRTPKQLLQECLSTLQDLLINHPDIRGGV